jgi:prepilin-type N-terminal cleavage/methylation domain-containing protein
MLTWPVHRPVLKSPKLSNQSAGYTIIEFMIALAIFSALLVVLIVTMNGFMNVYYKGIVVSSNQSAINTISSGISQAMELSSASVFDTVGSSGAICTGTEEFYYTNIGQSYPAGGGSFYEFPNTSGGCYVSAPQTPDVADPTGWAERKSLLSANMRLITLTVTQEAANSNQVSWAQLYKIDLKIAYASGGSTTDPGGDLLCSPSQPLGCSPQAPNLTNYTLPDIQCRPNIGYQYCDVEALNFAVDQRL